MRVEQQIEYEAKSDAEAIQVARDRLGRDAVILSSRPIRLGGVFGLFKREALWVTAGILVPDQDDLAKESRERMKAFQHLLEVRKAVTSVLEPQRASVPDVAPPVPQATVSAFQAPQAVPAAAAAQAYEANQVQKRASEDAPLAREVDEIKEILSKVLTRLDDGEAEERQAYSSSQIDENTKLLLDADVDRNIAQGIMEDYRRTGEGLSFTSWLADTIPTMGSEPTYALGGKRILFAGPTGVGKTTTIAKIAATQSLWENRNVVLITADTYRIAAVEQLRTYAKILGIPLEIAAEPKDIQTAIKKHKEADLILLDTAGRSYYDGTRLEELHALYEAFAPDSVHLVLAANIKYRDMLNVIDRMGVVPLSALIFTKLDETSSYGTILNVLRDFNLPVSFFTVGQNVPNDIEIARGDRFVDFLLDNTLVGKE